jgi:HEAT repeat protein
MRHLTCAFWLVLLAVGSAGCKNVDLGADPAGLWPFSREARTDHIPGLATPAERVTVLRKLTERAPQAAPEEQERVSRELAQAIRQEADPSLRMEIIRTLSHYPTQTASLTLRSALSDTDADVRIAACRAWGRRGGPEAVELLGEVVSGDIDADVRLAAIRALGETGDPKAAEALRGALADTDPATQRRVMLSLHEVTGKDFGGDARKWQAYLNGHAPEEDNTLWVVKRCQELWGLF